MSEQNTPAEGANASEANTTTTTTTTEPKVPEGYVSKSELENVLADLHKYKAKAKEYEEKSRKTEEERLRETQQWQKLAELKAREAQERDEELSKIKTSLTEEKKYSAVKEAALKAGIRPEAIEDLGMLSMKDVVIETTSTGRVNVLGADRFVDNLKQLRPHWFGKSSLNVNGVVPKITTGTVATEQDLLKMSLEASKSGDYTAYKKAFDEFNKRKRGV